MSMGKSYGFRESFGTVSCTGEFVYQLAYVVLECVRLFFLKPVKQRSAWRSVVLSTKRNTWKLCKT